MQLQGVWVFHPSQRRRAFVSWWPPEQALHYPELCCCIYEFLREPPGVERLADARRYLADLLHFPDAQMQRDRIAWTRAWIREAEVMEQFGPF